MIEGTQHWGDLSVSANFTSEEKYLLLAVSFGFPQCDVNQPHALVQDIYKEVCVYVCVVIKLLCFQTYSNESVFLLANNPEPE